MKEFQKLQEMAEVSLFFLFVSNLIEGSRASDEGNSPPYPTYTVTHHAVYFELRLFIYKFDSKLHVILASPLGKFTLLNSLCTSR